MTEFISLSDARQAMKGSFVGTVISIGDLKSGTKDGNDWSNKKITVEDTSARITLTVWNEEIKLFELNKTYEFHTPWFKMYKDEPVLALGKFAQIVKITSTQQEAITANEPEKPIDDTSLESLPEISDMFKDFIRIETVSLLSIEAEVRETMKPFRKIINDQHVGMITKEIYRESKKTNFSKATIP